MSLSWNASLTTRLRQYSSVEQNVESTGRGDRVVELQGPHELILGASVVGCVGGQLLVNSEMLCEKVDLGDAVVALGTAQWRVTGVEAGVAEQMIPPDVGVRTAVTAEHRPCLLQRRGTLPRPTPKRSKSEITQLFREKKKGAYACKTKNTCTVNSCLGTAQSKYCILAAFSRWDFILPNTITPKIIIVPIP